MQGNLTGARRTNLAVGDTSLCKRQHLYLLHKGVPPHFSADVGALLNASFLERRIERDGPWPPKSPDLNPTDVFFGGM